MRNLCKRMERYGPWIGLLGRSCGAGLLTALWVGLLLAEAGRFSAFLALLMGVVSCGLVWRFEYRRAAAGGAVSGMRHLGLCAVGVLALVSLVVTIPPSEFLLGGWDPGVYVHTASVLNQDGGLLVEAPDLAALDTQSRALIGRQGQDAWEPFLGMRMLPDGRLSPQFYHLYPVLMALLWPLGGVQAALLVNPLLHALSILLMYLWACRWVRPRWAFAAALLLALNPAQVWQAGFPTSELLAQGLLLAGLVATDRALSRRTGNRLDAILAGGAFGLMMLTKYEALLFVVPFSLLLLAGLYERARRGHLLILIGTLAALGVHAGVHQVRFSPLYYPMGNWVLPGLVAAGVLAFLVATVALLAPHRTPAAAGIRIRRMARLVALAGFAGWVFLAWYVRPHLSVEGRVLALFTRLLPGADGTDWFAFLVGRNARNFWYLKSLFGTVGLTVALAGVGLLILRKEILLRTAWLVASVGVLMVLMTQISHEPFMMFVARRMVPVILPLLCLGSAVLCDRCDWVLRKHPRRAMFAGVLVLGLSLSGTLGGTAFLATHREWAGLADWLDQLVDDIPPGSAVYSDAPGFAAPLRFMYGIEACEVHALAPGTPKDPMCMMLNRAQQNPSVFWLSWSAIPEPYKAYTAPIVELPLRSAILGSTKHSLPRYIRPRGAAFTLCRIVPPDGLNAGDAGGVNAQVRPVYEESKR